MVAGPMMIRKARNSGMVNTIRLGENIKIGGITNMRSHIKNHGTKMGKRGAWM